jgi:hypothetical protein
LREGKKIKKKANKKKKKKSGERSLQRADPET